MATQRTYSITQGPNLTDLQAQHMNVGKPVRFNGHMKASSESGPDRHPQMTPPPPPAMRLNVLVRGMRVKQGNVTGATIVEWEIEGYVRGGTYNSARVTGTYNTQTRDGTLTVEVDE